MSYLSFIVKIKGMFYCAKKKWLLATIFFTLASSFRSNGFLLSGYILWGMVLQPLLAAEKVRLRFFFFWITSSIDAHSSARHVHDLHCHLVDFDGAHAIRLSQLYRISCVLQVCNRCHPRLVCPFPAIHLYLYPKPILECWFFALLVFFPVTQFYNSRSVVFSHRRLPDSLCPISSSFLIHKS